MGVVQLTLCVIARNVIARHEAKRSNLGLSVGLLINKVEDDSELVRVGTHSYVKGAQCGNRTSWVGGIIKKPDALRRGVVG